MQIYSAFRLKSSGVFFQFIISVVILALAVYSGDAGFLPPAVVDISAGPYGYPYGPYGYSAAFPGYGYLGAPAYPYYGPGPSLTTSPYGFPAAFGPTTAYQVNPLANGHDGSVFFISQ